MSQSALSSAYGQRIALIRKHFRRGCRGIRHPQLGADGVLEWWTSQQGMVTSYAALSADAQQALLRAYDAHLATLDGLIEAMRARGLAEQAGQIEALRTPPALDRLYSVDGRLLVRLQQDPEPHPSSRWRPARRRCVGGAWRWAPCSFWRRCLPCCGGGSGIPWRRRPLRPLLPCPCPCPYRCLCLCRCQNQDPKPEPKPEPKRDSEWPTELAFVLETSDRMSSQPNKRRSVSHGYRAR